MTARRHRSSTWPRAAILGALVAIGAACGSGSGGDADAPSATPPVAAQEPASGESTADERPPPLGRVDLAETGNRVIDGPGAFTTATPAEFALDFTPAWVVPAPSPDGQPGWLVVSAEDGSATRVDATGASQPVPQTFDPANPPQVSDARALLDIDGQPIPFGLEPMRDARVVSSGDLVATLTDETDRYRHAVVGDEFEGGAISIVDRRDGSSVDIPIAEPDVIEAVGPMLADVDDDGIDEIVVTLSNRTGGSRLAVYETDGELLAESDPIGQGNRWRNLLAVAPIGPNGETEVIDVRTPHIGGTLQFFRLDGDSLVRAAAATERYSTHSIGSLNLDLGIVSDADGDGRLEVMLPTQDRSAVAVVTRDDSAAGATETFRYDLGARMATNLAAQPSGSGVSYAIGTSDGRLLVWPPG